MKTLLLRCVPAGICPSLGLDELNKLTNKNIRNIHTDTHNHPGDNDVARWETMIDNNNNTYENDDDGNCNGDNDNDSVRIYTNVNNDANTHEYSRKYVFRKCHLIIVRGLWVSKRFICLIII